MYIVNLKYVPKRSGEHLYAPAGSIGDRVVSFRLWFPEKGTKSDKTDFESQYCFLKKKKKAFQNNSFKEPGTFIKRQKQKFLSKLSIQSRKFNTLVEE